MNLEIDSVAVEKVGSTLAIIGWLILSNPAFATKELALTFDDAPVHSTEHFETNERTELLIKKLKDLKIPPVLVFANPCKTANPADAIRQLNKYRDAGYFIGNHTCSHPRLDDVGYEKFSEDAKRADELLTPLYAGQRFFRFPYLNESRDIQLRDQMRVWLSQHQYQNGRVSLDNDDYLFSAKINKAKKLKNKIDYKKVEALFIEHVLGAANFYDDLAVTTLGRPIKHVMLLHEMDATVLFLESLVNALKNDGWTLISVIEAYQDPLYLENPKNTYANNGIIAQLAYEKTGNKHSFNDFDRLNAKLNDLLNLKENGR